jgi:UDP-N-acetylglucosamine--N-acetylmuramyl-(pentapeptide) pyrophosphoryl-undecaprenol N-acetylglucosamine transferase
VIERNVRNFYVLVAGGSGGHVNPALALHEELEEFENTKTIFFTDIRGKSYLNGIEKTDIHIIKSSSPFKSGTYHKIFFMFYILIGFFQSTFKLIKLRPKLIISFGGYTSIPTCLAAYFLRIPIIIHEQNSIMGRANRSLSHFASVILTSFDNTQHLNTKHNQKVNVVGLPVRKNIKNLRSKYTPTSNEKKFNILVIGGSQGATVFNDLIPEIISTLPTHLKKKVVIKQNCLTGYEQVLQSKYEQIGIECEIQSYFENIGSLISDSDLIISRAGASMIFEICTIGRASILIPMAHALDSDQLYNAEYLAQRDACILYDEKNINKLEFSNKLQELILDKNKLVFVSNCAHRIGANDATIKIMKIIKRISH